MKKLNQWFHRQRKKSESIVTLEETLLGGGFLRYAWFRLRYFIFRTVVEVALRFVELKILLLLLPTSIAYILISIRIILVFGSGFWWGALEVFREKIRQLHRAGKLFQIPALISKWLSLSLLVSLASLIILLYFSSYQLVKGSFRIEVVYGLICCFRFLLEIPLTTFHSGIYAMRRIYRPLYWIIIVELISSLGALALFSWIGIWGLPLAFLISSLIHFSVRFYYTKKVYYLNRYLPLKLDLSLKRLKRFQPLFQNNNFFIAGIAHALMRYEVLLLILFFHHLSKKAWSENMLALVFLLTPIFSASREWAHMFYFDFKRLEGELYENFRRQLQKQVEDFSLLWGFVIWLVTLTLSQTVLNVSSYHQLLWLAPFFLINSILAYEQVKAFSDKNYNLVIQSGLIFLIGTLGLWHFLPDSNVQLAYLSLMTLGALRQVKKNTETSDPGSFHLLPLLDWLKRLKNLTEPVKVGWIEMNRETWQLQVLAEKIRHSINHRGAVTLCLPNKILWFETHPYQLKPEKVIQMGGGLLEYWKLTPTYAGSAMAIKELPMMKEVVASKGNTNESLIARFKKDFPKGFIYNFNQENNLNLSAQAKRQILFDAVYFSKNLTLSKSRSLFEVMTLCQEGSMELIFIMPKKNLSKMLRDQWVEELRQVNLANAIALTELK